MICLGTFCEKNYTAIINHPDVRNIDGREHRVVVNWWNILSIKCLSIDKTFDNKLQTVV